MFAAQHLFITIAAVNHRKWRRSRLRHPGSELFRRRLVDDGLSGVIALPEHDTIIRLRGRKRYPTLDHIAQHQTEFTLQRITPATTTRGDHANHLPFQHGLAIDEATEIIRLAFGADRDAQLPAPLAASLAVTTDAYSRRHLV